MNWWVALNMAGVPVYCTTIAILLSMLLLHACLCIYKNETTFEGIKRSWLRRKARKDTIQIKYINENPYQNSFYLSIVEVLLPEYIHTAKLKK